MRITSIRIALMAVILLVCSMTAFTQQVQAQDRPQRHRSNMTAEEREEHNQRRRERMIWHLLEYLQLSEEQSEKFMPFLNRNFKHREDLVRERMALSRELVNLLKDTDSSEQTLLAKLKEVDTIGDKLHEDRVLFLKQVEGILTTRQFVKLAIFEERFKMRLLGERNGSDRQGNSGTDKQQ
jgi:Spy/CpxP family protein refolding chaperone